LNEEIFWSIGEAQMVMDWYWEIYNRYRPHSSLDYKTPNEMAEGLKRQPLDSHIKWQIHWGKVSALVFCFSPNLFGSISNYDYIRDK
jgi:hypothetical protein